MKVVKILFVAVLMFCTMQQWSVAQSPSPCNVPVLQSTNVPTALSALDPMTGQPEIFYNPVFFQRLGAIQAPMYRWMLAHECSHQIHGDVVAGHLDPYGMMMINPQIELRADCDSAHYLRSQGDLQALQVAIQYWGMSGNNPTGPNYPTGIQRANMLSYCLQH